MHDPNSRVFALRTKKWEDTRELLILLKLQNIPGIVKVVDFEFCGSHLVLLEEWLDVPWVVNVSEAVQLITDLLNTLVTMHGRGYRHNDIKPGNIGWSKEQQRYLFIC
jgi:serine/threonine protein kinase